MTKYDDDKPLAYPLAWPAGWPRTGPVFRIPARFSKNTRVQTGGPSSYLQKKELSIFDALTRVRDELARLGVDDKTVVISTNVETRQDGFPRSDRRAPADPGVAVYWKSAANGPQCMAIDLYDTVAGNLAAVAATIDAMRAIERHGGAKILERAFQGFKALPSSTAPVPTAEQAASRVARHTGGAWNPGDVLHDREIARRAVRVAISKTHPDAPGGNHQAFIDVQEAKRVLTVHHGADL